MAAGVAGDMAGGGALAVFDGAKNVINRACCRINHRLFVRTSSMEYINPQSLNLCLL